MQEPGELDSSLPGIAVDEHATCQIAAGMDIHRSRMPIAIIVDGIIVDANVAACASVNCDQRGELVGKSWRDLIDSSQHGQGDSRIVDLIESGAATDLVEYEVVSPSGDRIPCVIHSIPIVFKGQPGFMAFISDAASYLPSMRALRTSNDSKARSVGSEDLAREVERLRVQIGRLTRIERFLLDERTLNEKLFEMTFEAVAVLKNGAITLCNPTFAEFVGAASINDLVGKPIRDFVPAPILDELLESKESASHPIEHSLDRLDGAKKLVDSIAAQFEKDGQLYGLTISRDAANRVEAERRIRESENWFATLFDLAPAGIMVIDDAIVFANKKMCEILGYENADPLIGKLPIDFTHPDYQADVRYRMEAGEAIDWTIPVERVYIRSDGAFRKVEVTAAQIPKGDLKYLVVAVRDISEASEALSRLQEADERFELALSGGNQGVWDWDIENDRATFSSEWRGMLGTSESDLRLETSEDFRKLVHPDDIESAWGKQLAHMRGESPQYEAEFRMRHVEGHWVWVLSRGRVTKRAADGSALRIVGTHTNISDRKEAEHRIEALNHELTHRARLLESANAELEAFAYSVSHDLRSPLRAIDGFAAALQEDYADRFDTDGNMYVGRIRSASKRMSQLIDDILALSRVTRHPVQTKAVDLTRLVESIVEEIRRSEPDRQIELVVQPDVNCESDPKLVQIVLENLLENAMKFTRNEESACIEFASQVVDGQTVFFVRDNGAGFDTAHAHNLFRPFVRLHSDESFEGHGIGLATVQRSVARLGGRVWATGNVGEGAVFHFTLGDTTSSNRA